MSQPSSQTSETKVGSYKSDVRDGMRIDWDVPIPMDDVYELDVEIWPMEAARHSRSFERPTSSISRWKRSARGFGPD
jgi:hypothetical protein